MTSNMILPLHIVVTLSTILFLNERYGNTAVAGFIIASVIFVALSSLHATLKHKEAKKELEHMLGCLEKYRDKLVKEQKEKEAK